NVGNTTTVTGQVTGSGGISKIGSGTLTLSASNGYSGGTTLNGGTLTASNNSAFGTGSLTLVSGTLQTGSTGITPANPVLLPNVTLDGGHPFTLSGPVSLLGASMVTNTTDVTLSGGLVGTGSLVKAGANRLALTGNGAPTGSLNVTAGTLAVDGTQPGTPIDVLGGAGVTGTGAVAPIVVSTGESVSPGAPATVPGSLSGASADFSSGGFLRVQVAGYAPPGVNYARLNLGAGAA